jgi:hypothetical protein
MGNYNPHKPLVLGSEWVPIFENNYTPDVDTELGYTFALDHSATVVSGGFFLDNVPSSEFTMLGPMVQVYRRGDEVRTGPVKRVVIPCDVASNLDGGTVSIAGPSITGTLTSRNDGRYLLFGNSDGSGVEIGMNFDVSAYSTELSGKRVLAVRVLYSAAGTAPGSVNPDGVSRLASLEIRSTAGSGLREIVLAETIPVATNYQNIPEVFSISLGNVNHYPGISLADQRRYPWRYEDLLRLENGASNALTLYWDVSGYLNTGASVEHISSLYMFYAALEVLYCEETRLAYGGLSAYGYDMSSATGFSQGPFVEGFNRIHLRPSSSVAVTGVALPAGQYTTTVTMYDTAPEVNTGDKPTMRAIRQLYELPSHRGVQVTRTLRENHVPTSQVTDILVPIALTTRSAVVTGTHNFNQVVNAPVYDGVTAQQEIKTSVAPPTATDYPQVRFYARRFGTTNVPLMVRCLDLLAPDVSITPDDFDALPEIIDGWKEVTLRFPASVVPEIDSSISSVVMEFSATSLAAGDQWQVLGMDGQGLASAPFNTDATTYGAPQGGTIEATLGGVLDPSIDLTVILAQDPPMVTGFVVTEQTQDLVVVDPECPIDQKCTPTGLYYQQLAWTPFATCDDFSGAAVTGVGTTENGLTWSTFSVGGVTSDWRVANGVLSMYVQAANTYRAAWLSTLSLLDVDVVKTFVFPDIFTVSGGAIEPGNIMVRMTSTSSYYLARISVAATTNAVTITLYNPAGTIIASATPRNIFYYPEARVKMRARIWGTTFAAKAWSDNDEEPAAWDVIVVDATGTTAGGVGIRAGVAASNSNTKPIEFQYDDVVITPHSVVDGYLEIQRQDDVDEDWATIAHVSDWCASTFNDFESVVGVNSRYRARVVNVLDFAGSWTDGDDNNTLSSPGITGAETGNGVLIFTTNEMQDGAGNLAYVQTWDGDVEETFSFPESEDVTLRQLYRRDFVTAFRPTERGGERFTRELLVNSAAVATSRLRDGFTSLRDMAWQDVSYTCVRNELGDRWLATIQVPSGRIKRSRRLYIAQIVVTEVTSTPCVVEVTE